MSVNMKKILHQLPRPALSAFTSGSFAFLGVKIFTKDSPWKLASVTATSQIISSITQIIIDKVNKKMKLSEGKQQIVKIVVGLSETFVFLAFYEALGFSMNLSRSLITVVSIIFGEISANFIMGAVLGARQFYREKKLQAAQAQ